MSATTTDIKLVVFDWAGTTIDHGSLAPLAAFIEAFAQLGVPVSADEARGPMGLHKKDHMRTMLEMPAVAERWRKVQGRAWNDQDLDSLYHRFIPLQMKVLDQHNRLVPGVLPIVAELRKQGIKIGATTGYFREAAERVYAAAQTQGYGPDCCVCAEDVPEGRPAPWMIYRIMETLRIYPPRAVVKVGDTVPDIGEGLSAGVFSIGVVGSGSEVGCTEEELARLPEKERQTRFAAARGKLLEAGAHVVIDSLAELPGVLTKMNPGF